MHDTPRRNSAVVLACVVVLSLLVTMALVWETGITVVIPFPKPYITRR
jgi:hypothetical protein